MKKIYLLAICLCTGFGLMAQETQSDTDFEEDETRKSVFKKENLFVGGTVNLSFGNRITALGISPYFGYSLNRYVDVAASIGVDYVSQRDNTYENDKLRQTIFSPGAFVRLFPIKFLFAHAQYEHNFIRYKYIYPSSFNQPSEKMHLNADAFLIGGGFASGRDSDQKSFYYFSILWDIGKDYNSPYVDNNGRAIPIIRAGYNVALFQGR